MNREEIIHKLVNFWTSQLGQPSEFGDALINSTFEIMKPKITKAQIDLFSLTLRKLLEEVEIFDYFILEVDYNPKSTILKKALDMSFLPRNALPGKTFSKVNGRSVRVKCGYGGDIVEI